MRGRKEKRRALFLIADKRGGEGGGEKDQNIKTTNNLLFIKYREPWEGKRRKEEVIQENASLFLQSPVLEERKRGGENPKRGEKKMHAPSIFLFRYSTCSRERKKGRGKKGFLEKGNRSSYIEEREGESCSKKRKSGPFIINLSPQVKKIKGGGET